MNWVFTRRLLQLPLRLYLQEILDTLRIVAVALSANPLHLLDLARLAGSLDVFKVNFGVLTEVHNGAQEVEQTCGTQVLILTGMYTAPFILRLQTGKGLADMGHVWGMSPAFLGSVPTLSNSQQKGPAFPYTH